MFLLGLSTLLMHSAAEICEMLAGHEGHGPVHNAVAEDSRCIVLQVLCAA
jgi:hypothetical protein